MPSICHHNALEDDWDVLYLSPFTRGAENESRRLSLTTLRLVSLTILIAPNQPLRIVGGYRRKVTKSCARRVFLYCDGRFGDESGFCHMDHVG